MSRATPEEAFAEARADPRAMVELSSRLFVGETLEDVSITGTKAWATRRTPEGHAEDVGFVRRKGDWCIRPLAKRPAAGRGT
jgi:hypothetical protein